MHIILGDTGASLTGVSCDGEGDNTTQSLVNHTLAGLGGGGAGKPCMVSDATKALLNV